MFIVVLVALAGCLAWGAATASASSLLSGYGGPGQGSQEILGSTLLNEPSGGSGSSGAQAQGSGGEGASTERERSAGTSAGTGSGEGSGRAQTQRSGRSRGGGQAPKGSSGSAGSARKPAAPRTRTAAPTAAVSSQALGLSAGDVLYIAIALAALALTAALTRQLARGARQGR